MSNKRTKQEKARIIEKCLDIEAEGGDVLKYLREEEHYVSPAATWFNIQRIDLGRDPFHRTSGKPTGVKVQRQKTPMVILEATKEEVPRPLNQRERARVRRKKVLELLQAGNDEGAREYLKSEGVKQVNTLISEVRKENGLPAGKPGPKPKVKKPDSESCENVKKSRERMKKVAKTVPITKLEPAKNGMDPSPYRFVPIREIEAELDKEFLRLIEKAHVMPINADMELIQEEIYTVLLQLHALREVKNMGRRALKTEVG
jgi:hypothetical protein